MASELTREALKCPMLPCMLDTDSLIVTSFVNSVKNFPIFSNGYWCQFMKWVHRDIPHGCIFC